MTSIAMGHQHFVAKTFYIITRVWYFCSCQQFSWYKAINNCHFSLVPTTTLRNEMKSVLILMVVYSINFIKLYSCFIWMHNYFLYFNHSVGVFQGLIFSSITSHTSDPHCTAVWPLTPSGHKIFFLQQPLFASTQASPFFQLPSAEKKSYPFHLFECCNAQRVGIKVINHVTPCHPATPVCPPTPLCLRSCQTKAEANLLKI